MSLYRIWYYQDLEPKCITVTASNADAAMTQVRVLHKIPIKNMHTVMKVADL